MTEAPNRGICLNAHPIRVIDGDTLVVAPIYRLRLRLLDCWAPELHKPGGREAKQALQDITEGRALRVLLPGSGDLTEAMSFGRALGKAWPLDEDGACRETDLSEQMVALGFATREKERS